MSAVASQITILTNVYSTIIQVQIKENINAVRHWPLRGEFTGDRRSFPQRASNAGNVSIWWRHHVSFRFEIWLAAGQRNTCACIC